MSNIPDNFPYQATIPIAAQFALDTANAVNAQSVESILDTLNTEILAAAQIGLYNINYVAGPLIQAIINQLTALGYIVVDYTYYAGVPLVYNYNIGWQQLNWPASGQPA
jgi:uncharacterized Fe-S radical SAM superfamily protein PflX